MIIKTMYSMIKWRELKIIPQQNWGFCLSLRGKIRHFLAPNVYGVIVGVRVNIMEHYRTLA